MEFCFKSFFIIKPSYSFPNRSIKCFSTHRLKLGDSLQNDTLKILEWPSVCNQVSAFTSTTMGFSAARDGLVPIGQTPDESLKLLNQTSAAFALPMPPDFSGIEDVSELVHSSVSGRLLSIGEICTLKRTLQSARVLFQQLMKLSQQSERYTNHTP